MSTDTKAEVQIPVVQMGFVVIWYPSADRDEGAACPAIVTKVSPGGVLSLTVWPENSKVPRLTSGTRYIDDPFHQKRPNFARELNVGSWDVVKGN